MKLLDLLNYVIVAVVLLLIGYVIKGATLWSFYSNLSVPYFASAIALALMIVMVTSLLFQKTPAELAVSTIIIASGVIIVFGAIWLFIYGWRNLENPAFMSSMLEWLGFSVILVLAFILPRLKQQ